MPRPARSAWLEAILLAATFVRLSGQATPPDSGTRLRVSAPGLPAGRVTGVLLAWRPDTLVLVRDSTGDTLRVPFGTVRRLEASQGMHSNYDTGAVAGLVFGAGIDALWILASSRSGSEDAGLAAPIGVRALPVVMGACAVVGSILGSATESERWRRVPLARDLPRLTIAPLRNARVGVGLRVGL